MVDIAGDKLLLLLSTDWFAPYWSCVGLYLPEQEKLEVQSHLREEVRHSFAEETYWNAPFDAERVQRTRQALLHAFAGNAVAARTIDSLLQHSTPSEDAGPSWLLSGMTEMLLGGSDEQVSMEVVDFARAAWHVASMGSKNWRDLCSRSNSSWDETVKGLTPDLPCWLADVLTVEIQVTDTFGLYWSELRDAMNAKQRGELLQWYEKTALDLTGEAIDLGALQ